MSVQPISSTAPLPLERDRVAPVRNPRDDGAADAVPVVAESPAAGTTLLRRAVEPTSQTASDTGTNASEPNLPKVAWPPIPSAPWPGPADAADTTAVSQEAQVAYTAALVGRASQGDPQAQRIVAGWM